jgi:hypothetical protein
MRIVANVGCLLGVLALLTGCAEKAAPRPGLAATVAAHADPLEMARTAQPETSDPPPLPPDFASEVRPFLNHYCVACHNPQKARGGILLDSIQEVFSAAEHTAWEKVADQLRAGTMPPAGKPQPTPAELDRINAWLDLRVFQVDCHGKQSPGHVTLRRLNRAEYNNTIRDLVGIDFRPADDFPADDAGYGFDTIADVLAVPPVLVEKYLAAAEQIITRAWQSPEARHHLLNPPQEDLVPASFREFPLMVRGEAQKRVRRPAAEKQQQEDPRQLELQHAYRVLQVIADRAYRRPATHEELLRLLNFVETAQRNGDGWEEGIRLAVQAILVSPHFLFRIERDADPPSPKGVAALTDFELATRLSYFLWSSMPDAELYQLAAWGKLRAGDNLSAQVRRMLADGKAYALVENFGGQWLQTRNLAELALDPERFPNFDESLRAAMRQETERFFDAIVREDRSILDFLDADYTFVNERLARHYGLTGVQGEQFQRVSLAGSHRSGILTQASILTVTSNPTRTSPVKRGKWILENLLGTPPAPPPPGVEPLREDRSAVLAGTLRQRLERHRTWSECASCHARMDPLGFGLENFDALGTWRTNEEGRPIDAAGTLPDGRSFTGPAELRALLKTQRAAFTRCLVEKLLTYALGRGLERSDRCTVEGIVRSVARRDYRFAALVEAIARSDAFRMREGQRGQL